MIREMPRKTKNSTVRIHDGVVIKVAPAARPPDMLSAGGCSSS